jgi:hypothetical protein
VEPGIFSIFPVPPPTRLQKARAESGICQPIPVAAKTGIKFPVLPHNREINLPNQKIRIRRKKITQFIEIR